jgi:hypothetical protein
MRQICINMITVPNSNWKWHSAMRARERVLFKQQLKFTELDLCYPIPREVGDLYDAPSDGGSYWMYSGFNHYYFEEIHPRWPWIVRGIPSREDSWKQWITKYIGK